MIIINEVKSKEKSELLFQITDSSLDISYHLRLGEDKKLESFVERIERLSKEKNNINFDIKKVFSEAKAMGYNPKIMRKVLALRKMDVDEGLEQEAILNTFRNTLGIY